MPQEVAPIPVPSPFIAKRRVSAPITISYQQQAHIYERGDATGFKAGQGSWGAMIAFQVTLMIVPFMMSNVNGPKNSDSCYNSVKI